MADKPLPRMVEFPAGGGGYNLPQPQPPTMVDNFAPPSTRTMLANIEKELSRTPLEEIYVRLAKLTYGELKQFAQEIQGDADKIWEKCSGQRQD
jgi:hypothetical protein